MADRVEDRPSSSRIGRPISSCKRKGPSQELHPERLADDFMIFRRFGYLHSRILLEFQDELTALEQDLMRLERDENNSYCRIQTRNRQKTGHEARKRLPPKMEEVLREYNSFILRLESLKRASPPGAHHQSIKDYLYHGPPIFMDYSEIRDSRWTRYESTVENFLREPETARWLDGPLNPDWGENSEEHLWYNRDRKRADDTTWLLKAKRKFNPMAVGVLLFWISHITAALAAALIAHTSTPKGISATGVTPEPQVSSGPVFNSLVMFLFTYWYFSAVGIIVPEFLAKGFVYARKIILGGFLACFGGFYILNIVMDISTASSITAIPAFFTVVLLLIRTM